jgi:hypothetical protein
MSKKAMCWVVEIGDGRGNWIWGNAFCTRSEARFDASQWYGVQARVVKYIRES